MKNLLLFLLLLTIVSCTENTNKSTIKPVMITQPILVEDDDWKFEGTENIILVPENRHNPNSRKIALHFLKFPAKEPSNLPPVVFWGAGPGEPYAAEVFFNGKRAEAWRYELNFVNQKRDVILINQRGNSGAPGLPISSFRYKWSNGGSLDKPFDLKLMNENRKDAYAKFIEMYQSKGVDLKGYDVTHFVEDIETIRKQLDYDKFAFIGNSFATQWALAYIQTYPKQVDRALFSGVEPLDNNYDAPDGIWQVLKNINEYAMTDSSIAKNLPKGGLIKAFKTIITRLEEKPMSVNIENDEGEMETIVVGADDLRYNYILSIERSYKGEIESWPKYITEMYSGDFRVLALLAQGRIYNASSLMINPLFNNSLGISKEREMVLNNQKSAKWLGNINAHYTSTREICPAPKVDAQFLQPVKHNIPIMIIHGDMDLSTPYDNANDLMEYLDNGHLLSIKRGSHNAKRALIFQDSSLTDKIYQFMDLDFDVNDFQTYKKSLPSTYELPEFNFFPIKGKSLYEKYSK